MPNLAATLKAEIRRLARKEVKAEIVPARRAAAQYRREIARLKRQLQMQEKRLARLASQKGQPVAAGKEEENPLSGLRFSARSVKAQRRRLKLSAEEFGKLVGVSAQTVYHWEQGRARPRQSQFQRLVAVRGLGRRDLKQRTEGEES